MDAAAASRRGKPNRGRPLVPPNYVSLRVLQELRQREKEERRRREEEEAAARRAREEQRKRQEEEEEAAARRFVEERRRREEEAAAARRARDAAAPRPEMRASSSSHTSSSFRYNERARGGQRLVVVADRPPPPPQRGECAAGKIEGATGGCRAKKGPDGGAATMPLRGGFREKDVGKGKVSPGVLAGAGEPDKPATASAHAGKPEEKRNGEASGCQGTSSVTSSVSGELAKLDIASYRGPARPTHRHRGKKGLDAMTSSIGEVVEASPLPVVNLENKGKSKSGDQSTETALASLPGKVAEASPPRGVKPDNKGKKKPLAGRQAGAAPSSDLPNVKKVEASGCEGTSSVVNSLPGKQADADGASYPMRLRPTYMPKWKKRLDGRNTETTTTIVAGKVTDASPLEGVSLEIKGIKGLTEQGTETALARMPIEAADASLARVLLSENKGKTEKEPSGGRHAGMAGTNAQPCPATEGSRRHRSSGGQGTTWEAKTEGLQAKQTVVEVKVQPNLSAESSSYLRSSGDQGMIQAAKSEDSKEKQPVVDMRTPAQLKPWDMRNSGRQWPGGHSRVNVAARQHDMIWVPKGAAVLDSAEVGKFP